MNHLHVTLLAAASFGLGACANFDHWTAQFDIVAGLDGSDNEPTQLDYAGNVAKWSARLEIDGVAVDDRAYENPSGFARDQIVRMVDAARDDLEGIALVTPRLLLVGGL